MDRDLWDWNQQQWGFYFAVLWGYDGDIKWYNITNLRWIGLRGNLQEPCFSQYIWRVPVSFSWNLSHRNWLMVGAGGIIGCLWSSGWRWQFFETRLAESVQFLIEYDRGKNILEMWNFTASHHDCWICFLLRTIKIACDFLMFSVGQSPCSSVCWPKCLVNFHVKSPCSTWMNWMKFAQWDPCSNWKYALIGLWINPRDLW